MSDSADDETPMLGMDLPETAPQPQPSSGPYRVLARKYRPQTFAELIGQDAMVRTLGNAIARDRLAHAFLMTGVRGVGKTSTARLIAKALNCIGPDGQGGPTIDPCGVCEPCRAITEGRHIDVIEMDAASNTGVDDVREIIEAVRYAAVSARYKIYIIDEVHMLSRNAFNALLKTLEEPPPHVKFLFATTEVNKVPVTVLSRCQRFDLRRITPDMLFAHFSSILQKEGVEAEAPAIWLIANAAEGSVRDGLSILDQAIAHADLDGGGKIGADQVRVMLGLSDRTSIAQLMATILGGDAGGAIDLALLRLWAPALLVGVVGGAGLGGVVDGRVLVAVFAVVAALVAADMILRRTAPEGTPRSFSRPVWAALGVAAGGISAMMGIGGGTVCVPLLNFLGYDIRRAVGTSAAIGFVIGLPGALVYAASGWGAEGLPPFSAGYVNLAAAAVIVPLSTSFARVGVRIAHAIPRRALRLAFGLFLGLTSARMAFDLFGG